VRLFLAMMSHETNTFSNVPTDRAQFEARDLRYGGEIIETYRGTGTCLGGMIEAAERRGAMLLPSVAAAASPAGPVTRDIYQDVKSTIHYRAAFEPIAKEIIEVDAPGLSSSNLERFAFKRVRRPIFPLDSEATYP